MFAIKRVRLGEHRFVELGFPNFVDILVNTFMDTGYSFSSNCFRAASCLGSPFTERGPPLGFNGVLRGATRPPGFLFYRCPMASSTAAEEAWPFSRHPILRDDA